jgi:hypothetical protein
MVRPRYDPPPPGVLPSSPTGQGRAVLPESFDSISSVALVCLTPYIGVKRKDITALFQKMQVAITQN